MDLPEIIEAKRLTLGPDDRLIVRVDRELSDEQFQEMRRHLRVVLDEVFGREVKALLLEPGMDVEVIGPDEAT